MDISKELVPALMIIGANLMLIAGCVATTVTLFLWARKEATEDRRQIFSLISEIQQEMKDFHARLCVIEERNKGK